MTQLPAGWRVSQYSDFEGCELEFYWGVYRWMTWTPEKKHFWSRQPLLQTGWRQVSWFRDRSQAECWAFDTIAAIEEGAK